MNMENADMKQTKKFIKSSNEIEPDINLIRGVPKVPFAFEKS